MSGEQPRSKENPFVFGFENLVRNEVFAIQRVLAQGTALFHAPISHVAGRFA
jgi:hypothetical protein